jgi:hypothetical protein
VIHSLFLQAAIMFPTDHRAVLPRWHRAVVAMAAIGMAAVLAAQSAHGQGPSGIRATVTYTGSSGPVSRLRPLCLCVYTDPSLQLGIGCFIAFTNGATFSVTTFDANDYFLIAFLDLDLDERVDLNEPFEIYRDRSGLPADPVTASPGLTDVEITFGDENLPSAATPTATPTSAPSSTPTTTAARNDCTGDCDGSGEVAIDEIIAMVAIALGNLDIEACSPGDHDGNGAVEIDEILAAVNNAGAGCPSDGT